MQIKNKQSGIKMQTRKISKNTTHKKTTSALKKAIFRNRQNALILPLIEN
jgi:hypothetical protein